MVYHFFYQPKEAPMTVVDWIKKSPVIAAAVDDKTSTVHLTRKDRKTRSFPLAEFAAAREAGTIVLTPRDGVLYEAAT